MTLPIGVLPASRSVPVRGGLASTDLVEEATHTSATAKALYAAKQLAWKGQGELPQLPWAQPYKGLVLVIDMWSGIGGLLVVLLALGVR